jgi:murein DD-endopeptidase MepM/ murein hydrolase activator NlpD
MAWLPGIARSAVISFGFGVEEARLAPMLAEQGVRMSDRDCVPYVAATGGEGGAASAILQGPEPAVGAIPTWDIRKTPDGITVTPGACDCPATLRRVLEFPVQDAAQRPGEVLAEVYGNVRWQLDILLPQMMRAVAAKQEAARESHRSAPDVRAPGVNELDGNEPMVRVVLTRQDEYSPEQLQSIEILESASGKELDGAWWLQRSGGPGVLIGMEGVSYERLLWLSPVKYVKMSRGVGSSATTVTVRVPVPKGETTGKPKTRKVTVREYHIGADLLAPKGTEVHAVGEGKVFFAGRYGGYGNLIILDHGLGYQTYYAHLSVIKREIKAGAKVSRGDVIGLVGSTGHSTAPHLHFETRKDGKYVDPFDDTRQLEFWVLSPDDQERLGMEMLASSESSTSGASATSAASAAPHGGTYDHDQ